MKEIKVRFNTLTPLWTGDAWRESNELKPTGIIGSLRWWFEALVRGMGYKACNSTSENKCKVEIKNPEDVLKIHEKICPVCYLFGTTGWKSRFSVVLEDNNLTKPYNGKILVNINGGKSWYYESGLMGDATFKFQYDETIIRKDTFSSILKILLFLVSEHGMLGAKTSMGYGVVKFKVENNDISITEDDWKNFEDYLQLFDDKFKGNINWLPNLRDFFFVKFNTNVKINELINDVSYQDGIIETDAINKWKDKNWCITSPIVRKCLRCIFRGQYSKGVCWNNRSCKRNYWWNYYDKDDGRNKQNSEYNNNFTIDNLNIGENEAKNIRHFLMGSTSEPEFSAIQVSHVYKNNGSLGFRIYGWLPPIFPLKYKPNKGELKNYIKDIIDLLVSIYIEPQWNPLSFQICHGICWNSSNNLSLVNGNIKKLFNISGGSKS